MIAVVLRVAFMVQMPYGFFISDTNEFMTNTINVLKSDSRTPLGKIVYGIPRVFGVPLLPWAATVQHLVGLTVVMAGGILCRLWLTHWRWWIVPFTLVLAVHPSLLWYEHMCIPDSLYVACVTGLAAAVSVYYQSPTPRAFRWLCWLLVLTALCRQEGFLFLPLGLLVLLSRHRGQWRAEVRRLGTMLAVMLGAWAVSRTSQGGQMLLTSTVHLAPDRLWSVPEFSPSVREMRDRFAAEWPAYPAQHNPTRKYIGERAKEFLAETRGPEAAKNDRIVNQLCKRAGMEVALRNWWRLPGIAYRKFLATFHEEAAPSFGPEWAHRKHVEIFFGKPGEKKQKAAKYMKTYFGREFETREEAQIELARLYRVATPDWLSAFQRWFTQMEFGWKLPDRTIGSQVVPGLPWSYLLGFVGICVAAWCSRPWLNDRQLWFLFLVGSAFAIFATTSLRSRYRLVYEPWFFLGLFCLLDTAVTLVRGRRVAT